MQSGCCQPQLRRYRVQARRVDGGETSCQERTITRYKPAQKPTRKLGKAHRKAVYPSGRRCALWAVCVTPKVMGPWVLRRTALPVLHAAPLRVEHGPHGGDDVCKQQDGWHM